MSMVDRDAKDLDHGQSPAIAGSVETSNVNPTDDHLSCFPLFSFCSVLGDSG